MRGRATWIAIALPLLFSPVPFALAQGAPDVRAIMEAQHQEAIDAGLRSAREHAAAGRKEEAIADYRKVLALEPGQPEAVAELKALAGESALLPPLTLSPKSPGGPPPSGGGGGSGPGLQLH